MEYQIEVKSPCRVAVSGKVPADVVQQARQRVLAEWRRNARLPGFRVGKAPQPMVERRFAKEIGDDVQEELVKRAFAEIRRGETLRPAGPLEVQRAEVGEDGAFELAGELDVYPEITLPPLDGFAPPAFGLEPGGEEVDAAVARLQDRQAAWEPLEGEAVREGVLVEAALHGEYPDGGAEPFDQERVLFEVGKGEVPAEVEGAVQGHTVGDEVEVERTLGPEAPEALRGKRVVYTVRIASMRRKQLPVVDDEFARSLGVEEGLEDLRRRLSDRIRLERAHERRRLWREALIVHLRGGDGPPLPERLVRERLRDELVDFARGLAARGVDPEKAEIDWPGLEREMRGRVEERLRGELVLDELARSLDIVVTDADVDTELEKEAKRAGVPFAELKGNLAKRGDLEGVRDLLRRERAVDEALGRMPEGEG